MHGQLQDHVEISQPFPRVGVEEWFAIQTKPRHEKKVASALKEKDISVFLPLYNAVHQWSDRQQKVQIPLFPNYVFVRIIPRLSRTAVLQTNGVRSFVGIRGEGTYVREEEIEAIQRILTERIAFAGYPFLNIGQRVRIRGGSLDGVQGILVAAANDRSLVVSVECLQRSLAIRIDGYCVDPV